MSKNTIMLNPEKEFINVDGERMDEINILGKFKNESGSGPNDTSKQSAGGGKRPAKKIISEDVKKKNAGNAPYDPDLFDELTVRKLYYVNKQAYGSLDKGMNGRINRNKCIFINDGFIDKPYG